MSKDKGEKVQEITEKTEKAEKTKETHVGEAKKKSEAPAPVRAKGHEPLPGACNAMGCKAKATLFNFCAEHYEHFKFGLIKKTGEQVPDYEKKFEHFARFQQNQQRARKAA